MTERILAMRHFFINVKAHHPVRSKAGDKYALAQDFAARGLSDLDRETERLLYMLEHERPVLFDDEQIAFVRTLPTVPELHTAEELALLKSEHWLHELGDVNNISVDYTLLLRCGLEEKRRQLEEAIEARKQSKDTGGAHYLTCQHRILQAVSALAKRYRELAVQQGNTIVAQTLEQVPERAPRTLLEALQMLRILHFTMWCGRNYHNTLGRFDQYIYPYLLEDMRQGRHTEESALELLEEFFLTCNRDSDLYPGMQQGDNGQSMVLGGRNPDGSDSYNLLSELCLKASLELKLIDPKINLRVHSATPLDTYLLGTELTKQGLGFPQYSNDDVVIPGLMDLGYSEQDAHNYVVAACWEFIIPGVAMDIPNIEALSFSQIAAETVQRRLAACVDYDALEQEVFEEIDTEARRICDSIQNLYVFPAPFVSLMMQDCVEQAKDISLGGRYNNFGIHGTGIATAADSLAAVKQLVFEQGTVDPQTLLDALSSNFEGYEQLCNQLRYDCPKMGNNIDAVDAIAVRLLDRFAQALHGKRNERGGIFRAGTGSAMYYIWHAKNIPATPDGRRQGEGLAANYSPSLFSRCKGPVSIIQSFAKPDLRRVINGGPLTLELHDTVFRTEESMNKVAMLVKSFMDLGGHQLQLNAVNRDTMLDAQQHPENHRNLIVRVWGWSGYFVELDQEYQDHIIQRMELVV